MDFRGQGETGKWVRVLTVTGEGGGGEIQFYSTRGREKYSFTIPEGQRNTVLQGQEKKEGKT